MILTPEQVRKGVSLELQQTDFLSSNGTLDNVDAYIQALKTFPWFFIENHQTVSGAEAIERPVKLFYVQKYLEKVSMEQLKHYPFCRLWILKPRQIGSSWYWARRGLHSALFNNFNVDIFANAKSAIAQSSIFNYAYEGLNCLREQNHPFIQHIIETTTDKFADGKVWFKGGGRIETVKADKQAVGRTTHFAHISEASRIDGFEDDFWESFYPSLHAGFLHYCIVESTARHTGAHFMDVFKEQYEKEKESGKIPELRAIFIPCYMFEEYRDGQPLPEGYDLDEFWKEENESLYGPERMLVDKDWWDPYAEKHEKLPLSFWFWRRMQIDGQSSGSLGGFTKLQMFQQNFPMSIQEAELIAGDSVFPRETLQKRKLMVLNPVFKGDITVEHNGTECEPVEDPDANRFVYQRFDSVREGFPYYIGADPSNFQVGDSATGVVYSPMQNAFVAMLKFRGLDEHHFVQRLIAMGMYWNNAMVGYEANLSKARIPMLKKFLAQDLDNPIGAPYRNLYTRMTYDQAWNKTQVNPSYGFWMTDVAKIAIKDLLWDMLRDFDSGIPMEELLDEMWSWRQVPDKLGKLALPNAPKGKHDDLIVAAGIALWIARDSVGRPDLLKQMGENSPDEGKADYHNRWKKFAEKQDGYLTYEKKYGIIKGVGNSQLNEKRLEDRMKSRSRPRSDRR